MVVLGSTPLSTLGVTLYRLTDWLTPARGARVMQATPGRLGVRRGGATGAPPRQLQLGIGTPIGSVLTDRGGYIARVEHALAGCWPLLTPDRPGIRTWVETDTVAWIEAGSAPALAVGPIDGTITVTAIDGGSEDVQPTVYALSSTPTAIPLGTLPSLGWLRLWGGSAPRVVTMRDGRGELVSELTLTTVIPSNGHVALDLDRCQAWLVNGSGVWSRADSTVTGTWPALDPDDALGAGLLDGASSVRYPALALSSGTGQLVTRRRWRI